MQSEYKDKYRSQMNETVLILYVAEVIDKQPNFIS